MNKVLVDNLINEMVKVIIADVDVMINNSNLIVKVKTDAMTASLIAKSIVKYNMDWSSDIIRDEVIATLYESMLTVSKGVEPEEIQFDNPAYMGKVYNLVELKLRDYLVPKSRKNKDGEIIGYKEEAVSPLSENDEAISKLEVLLNKQDAKNLMMVGEQEKMNQFKKWFDNNKKTILTKKQLMFIENEILDIDRRTAWSMRNRIADRVSKAYTNKYGTASYRIATLMDQKETLETILEAEDFKAALLPHMEELFIIDTIIDNVSPKATKAFNKGDTSKEVIKEYRIALFKALGNIIEILEREGF